MNDNEVYVLGGWKRHHRKRWTAWLLIIAVAVVAVALALTYGKGDEVAGGKQLDAVEILPKNAKAPLFDRQYPMEKFYVWIGENLEYPESLETIDAKVVVSFVIDTDGQLGDIAIVSQPEEKAFGEQVVNLLKKCPTWEPARLADGKATTVSYTLPVIFNRVKK